MSPRYILRGLLLLVALSIALFAFATWRFHARSKACFQQARDQAAAGESAKAVALYDRAIRAHSLFDGYGQQAAEALRELAAEAEDQGETRRAAALYQTLLSALGAIDTGLSPARRGEIRELEIKLEKIRAVSRAAAGKQAAPN